MNKSKGTLVRPRKKLRTTKDDDKAQPYSSPVVTVTEVDLELDVNVPSASQYQHAIVATSQINLTAKVQSSFGFDSGAGGKPKAKDMNLRSKVYQHYTYMKDIDKWRCNIYK